MKLFQRILSTILVMTLCLGFLPAQALAAPQRDPSEKPTELVTSDGEVVPIDEDWDAEYPYGAFAFDLGEVSLAEGGEDLYVDVYRMGGTSGRASVYILFNPFGTPIDDEGTLAYGSAAGFDDLAIETEDAQPIAAYQPLGKDPDPDRGSAGYIVEDYTGEDAQEGDKSLRLDTQADSYQWYAYLYNGWRRLEGATERGIVLSETDLEARDFYCVYTVDGARLCSDSYQGVPYEKPEPEVLPPVPDDIELAADPTFSRVLPEEGASPTDPYIFELTFADGEWVKQIHLTPLEDDRSEPMKFATFIMIDHDGAEVYNNAGTLILSIEDNEEPEPFTLRFEQTAAEVDKAAGKAVLTVVRTGGTQLPVSVSYRTADGSAKAGQDYEAVSGEIAFYGDLDRQTIEIPLIDDGVVCGADKSFTVTLGEVKGDRNEFCTLGASEARVSLYNSGTGEHRNLATMLAVTNRSKNAGSPAVGDPAPAAQVRGLTEMLSAPGAQQSDSAYDIAYDVAEDVSGLAVIGGGLLRSTKRGPVTGAQQVVEDADLLTGRFVLGSYQSNGGGLQTYQYGSISFGTQQGGQYWEDYAYIAGRSQKDYTNWSGGNYEGDSRIIKSDTNASTNLTIPHMSQYYDRFEGWGNFNPEWSNGWITFWCGTNFVYPKFCVGSTNNHGKYEDFSSLSQQPTSSTIYYWSSHGLNSNDLDISDTNDGWIEMYLREWDGHGSHNDAWGKLTDGKLHRRVFQKDLNLTVHTANDGEEGGGNVATAPANAAALKAGSGVYESMKPVVTVVPNAGGTNGSGRLYVGSQIKVSLQNTASYFPYSGEALNVAVYLTRSDGSTVPAGIEKKDNDYVITLFWNGISQNDVDNETFTINVVMTRRQEMSLDLTPSVERQKDRDGKPKLEIDSSKVPDAVELFWNSAGGDDNRIKVICSTALSNRPHFQPDQLTTVYIDGGGLGGKEADPIKSLGTLENVQCINFNRSEEDRIVYHNKVFKGNEDIWLDVADLASATASFLYYNEAYLSVAGIMNAAVDSVGVYFDANANGKIDGIYDAATGYFVPDEASGDSLLLFIDKGDTLNETAFQPVKDEDGTVHEYFAKVFFTLTPRSFYAPAGHENDTAQVLPALTTSVTDAAHYAELTEAQQSYRYVFSGKDSQNAYTADGHPMYGAAATAVQFVDVPLGGDYAPAHGDDNNETMIWEPDYHGHLLTAFADPEPIVLEHSMLGDNHPLVDYDYDEDSGKFTFSDAAKAELNDYLGSLAGDSTIALCVQEQKYGTADLPGHIREGGALQPESNTLIERSVYMDAGNIAEAESNDDIDSGFPEMSDNNAFPGFNVDGSISNSGFKFTFPGAMPYATVVFNSDAVLFIFSVPILNWANDGKGRKWGPQHSWNHMVGKDDKVDELQNALDENDMTELQDLTGAAGDGDMDAAPPAAQQGKMKSHNFSMSLTVTAIITLKHNKVTNGYEFDEFTAGIVCTFSYRYENRFPTCPVAYFFVKVSFSLSVTLSAKRYTLQTNYIHPVASPDKPIVLKQGEVFELESPYNYMDIQFDGQIYISPLSGRGGGALENSNKGMLKSAGVKKTVKLTSSNGTSIPGGDKAYIRIVAQKDTTITKLDLVTKYEKVTRFGGVKLVLTPGFEIGAGVGIDIAKIELSFRIAVEMAFRFAAFDPVTQKQGTAEVDHIKIQLGVYLCITALAFSFEFELLGGTFTYHPNPDPDKCWTITFDSSFAEPDSLTAEEGIGLPAADKHDLRSPNALMNNNKWSNEDEFTNALNAYKTDAPFEVSGYGASSAGITLADGLARGYDCKVVTAGGNNYLLYTISRENAGSALDHSMLVMSRIITTGTAPGLVNPVSDTDGTPYLVVDDDAGGDLECEAWADGSQIRIAWVSYADHDEQGLRAMNASALFRAATKNRVVKTATFDVSNPAGGFSAPVLVGGGDSGDYIFQPAAVNDMVAYVEADPMDDDVRAALIEKYTAALKAANYDPSPENTNDARRKVGAYRLQTQTAIWDMAGGVNRLTLAQVDGGAVARSIRSELAQGQIVDNLEFTKIGSDYYLAFTTSETNFVDADGNETADPDQIANMVTIRRLCLKVIHDDGTTLSTEKTRILRTVFDFETERAGQSDGVYVGGEKQDANDPTLANLRFLSAVLGNALGGTASADKEVFLLFEMNGCTYIVRQGDLQKLAFGQTGTILPFFDKDTDPTVGKADEGSAPSLPGRTGAVLGADGDGNLAAVYITSVPNTANNALCLAKYDAATGKWGDGTMIAMNHMSVYETAIREKWSPAETSEAYFDESRQGGMDQFRFDKLQIALGTKGAASAASGTETEGSVAQGEGSPTTTLLVLAQGTYDKLRKGQNKSGDIQYYADPDGLATHTGIYAVSYGAGQQAVGKASLSFLNHDFGVGASLVAAVGFTNTGDVSIRGSEANPITVTLTAEGDQLHSTPLARWTITDNILPGQEVKLNGTFRLPVTLPEGTVLNLNVAEDDTYADDAFAAVIRGLKKIESVPELGYEGEVSFDPFNSNSSGSAVYQVDFTVGNRGNADSQNVYVRFTYDTGETRDDGSSIYAPIDISRNDLTVGQEAPLKLSQTQSDVKNGILWLGNIHKGYGRRVTGTVTVPSECFTAADGARAEVRIEIFSGDDTVDENGKGVHNEYNSVNNVEDLDLAHSTFFDLPAKLTIPLGTTLRMPVRYNVTDPDVTHVLVAEFPHVEADQVRSVNSSSRFKRMEQHISELFYDESSFSNGVGVGTVVITPMEEGSSFVRIMDLGTNHYTDVACEVTPGGDGLNVFPDTGVFTFRNADGSAYDPAAAPTSQDWMFSSGVDQWGADNSAPYRNDLAKAKTGAKLTYESVSESIKLVFNGTVKVESTFPGFNPVTITAVGGSGRNAGEAETVTFGSNPGGTAHTVTITVTEPAEGGQYAELDRLAEYYHGDSCNTIADDHGAMFYWSESFPQAGSLSSGTVSQTLSIVDDTLLTDVWLEPTDIATAGTIKKDNDLWTLPLTISGNGTIIIHARDSAGNHAIEQVDVDWWGGNNLTDTAFSVTTTSWSGTNVKMLTGEEGGQARHIVVTPGSNAPEDLKISVSYLGSGLDGSVKARPIAMSATHDNSFRASEDGLYLVRAEHVISTGTDPMVAYRIVRNDGTVEEGNGATKVQWSAKVLRVTDGVVQPDPEPYEGGGTAQTKTETVTGEDGTVAKTTTDAAGTVTGVEATVSDKALESALQSGEPAPIPVTLPVGQGDADTLPVIHIELPADLSEQPVGQLPQIAIPVTGADSATVAFQRGSDGSWTPVKDCRVEDGKLILPVERSCDIVIGSNARTFPDVDGKAWYADHVAFVTARGIFNGTGSGFEPEGTMTRAMIAQVLFNLDRRSASGIAPQFRDVDPDAWYADAVGWAAEEGIILGYDGAFSPDVAISRQDLVTILYRYARAAGYPIAAGADLSGFSDADDVESYAREAMAWAVAVGAVSGMGDGTLAPGGTATRAQVAKIMQVFISAIR